MPREIIFAQVLDRLLTEQYRRNRSELAQRAHVSPSALSQYTRRRATPSLDVLVHLADALGVSLDYLVLGRDATQSSPEFGHLASHIETALRQAETRAASVSDLVSRTGARLGESIREIVEAILEEDAQPGGLLNADEVEVVETCSEHTTIMTTTLDMDVSIVGTDGTDPATTPSLFTQLIANNISAGSRYDYYLPNDQALDQPAEMLNQQLATLCGRDHDYMAEHLRIFRVSSSCVPGYVFYKLSTSKVNNLDANTLDRLSPFLYVDPADENFAYAATIEPVSRSYQYFALMQISRVKRLLAEVTDRQEQGEP